MYLFKISRTDTWDYDEYDEVVVRAANSLAALRMVIVDFKYDGMTQRNTKVERITEQGPAEVICESFNAG